MSWKRIVVYLQQPLSGLSWGLAGCLWCISIVGIPVGLQCFKFASLSFFPFGKDVNYGGGAGSPAAQHHLASGLRNSAGAGACGDGDHHVRDDYRNSVWPAAF